MFAKKTEFTRTLFKNLVHAHMQGPSYKGPGEPCLKTECDCFKSWMETYPHLNEHLLVVSGTRYSRQECTFRCCAACELNRAVAGLKGRPVDDPSMEILHFTSSDSRGHVQQFLRS